MARSNAQAWLTRHGAAEWIDAVDPSAIARARRVAERLAHRSGLPKSRRDEWLIVVSEATSNLVRHGSRGAIVVAARADTVELFAFDHGPGLRDPKWALLDGSTTGSSAGLGLGAIERLADVFALHSAVGQGTVVYAGIGVDEDLSGVVLPRPGDQVSGDGWAVAGDGQRMSALVFDGLGHGPAASRSAERALHAFAAAAPGPPAALLRAVSEGLTGERGGVGSAVTVGPEGCGFGGVGNIDGRIVSPLGEERRLVPSPGTLGAAARTVREVPVTADVDGVFILSTDGFRSRWRAKDLGGVWARPAGLIVGVLLWAAHRANDDAGVLVFRGRVADRTRPPSE